MILPLQLDSLLADPYHLVFVQGHADALGIHCIYMFRMILYDLGEYTFL